MRTLCRAMLCGVTLMFSTSLLAHENPTEAESDRARNHLISEVMPAVYSINVKILYYKDEKLTGAPRASREIGAGFCVSDDGLVITNAHIARPDNPNTTNLPLHLLPEPELIAPDKWRLSDGSVAVMTFTLTSSNGTSFSASIVAVHPVKDLAILAINAPAGSKFRSIEFVDDARAGDGVIAIGSPYGMSFTVTHGIVGNPRAYIEGDYYLQTDTAINPGNSGGPLVRMRDHKVVGVVVANANPYGRFNIGIGFAVPAADAKPFTEDTVRKLRAKNAAPNKNP